jgi:membrane protease YdiL (CAAX protease family)
MKSQGIEKARFNTPGGLRWIGIAVSLAIPTLITLLYFVLAADLSRGNQQTIYVAVKIVQFSFPVFWVLLILREPAWRNQLAISGWRLGTFFGLAVVAAGFVMYTLTLRGTPLFREASALIVEKLVAFGIDRPWKYAAVAIFYSVLHSLLEEYYWRWFVFGQLRRVVAFWPAALAAAGVFASHHVIVLAIYFGAASPITWLFSSAVAVGGLFWSWLYERTGSLVGPWVSHLLIDAGIFAIGYDIVLSSF